MCKSKFPILPVFSCNLLQGYGFILKIIQIPSMEVNTEIFPIITVAMVVPATIIKCSLASQTHIYAKAKSLPVDFDLQYFCTVG